MRKGSGKMNQLTQVTVSLSDSDVCTRALPKTKFVCVNSWAHLDLLHQECLSQLRMMQRCINFKHVPDPRPLVKFRSSRPTVLCIGLAIRGLVRLLGSMHRKPFGQKSFECMMSCSASITTHRARVDRQIELQLALKKIALLKSNRRM